MEKEKIAVIEALLLEAIEEFTKAGEMLPPQARPMFERQLALLRKMVPLNEKAADALWKRLRGAVCESLVGVVRSAIDQMAEIQRRATSN